MDLGQYTSDGGDLQGSVPAYEPGKKKRFSVKVVIVVAAVFVIIGIVITWLIIQKPWEVNTLKDRFNSYANYVLFGKESLEDFEPESISNGTPYFKTEGLNLDVYLNTEEKKYNELSELYYAGGGENDLSKLANYYQYFVSQQPLTMEDVVNEYIKNGYDVTASMINNKFPLIDGDWVFYRYSVAERNLAMSWLEIAREAGNQNCILDGKIDSQCYAMGDSIKENVGVLYSNVLATSGEIYSDAINVFYDLYGEIYEAED